MKYINSYKIKPEDIKLIRKKLGVNQKELANFLDTTVLSVNRWENGAVKIPGPINALLYVLYNNPDLIDDFRIPDDIKGNIRIKYFRSSLLCSIIDVDYFKRKVYVTNYSSDYRDWPFGKNVNPSYEDFEDFLESRCFPRTRDKMKIILKELDIPYYDPMMIIKKTKGAMAEDDYTLEVEK